MRYHRGMYERKDAWYRKAKREGYRSRAAYKLAEIAAAENVARPGAYVIDAGAAPGGWSQVLLELVGKRGKVAAVDILPMDPLPAANFRFFRDDVTLPSLPPRLLAYFGREADAVVSDAAPNTTGVSFADQARSADLVRAVHALAGRTLRKGGTFLAKIFDGAEADAVMQELKGSFSRVRRVRPGATRRESFEIYLLATGFKG
ncbi:MAG: RlmE family RNA methyltransferase [Gemmatimonadota bacterium]